jgi:hypothetical protein
MHCLVRAEPCRSPMPSPSARPRRVPASSIAWLEAVKAAFSVSERQALRYIAQAKRERLLDG